MDGAHPFRPRSSLTPVHPRASPVVDPMLSSAHGASFHRLEEERRSVLVDLQARQQAHVALEADVKRLYKELEQERAETFEQTRQLRERLEHARREGANLELQILKSEIGASDKGEEVEEVKHQVEVKTKEIVKAMQRLSDQHRSAFQHVATLTSDMLRACSSRSPASNDLLQQGVQTKGHEVKQAPAKLVHPPSEEGVELPWFQAMKANLEEYGDVEVFLDQQPQECMSCCQAIEASYRARPRKCSHVFHVECLLHCWSEGTCPVCGASFAPEARPKT
ncbi:unnamed protein product [Durusdinium trenchii]|uniref:RING-type domain-containing protein n=1 Tax=Durusdinium trenchii TaxID=1381693 RepID=A0ABP0H4V9_9DINO